MNLSLRRRKRNKQTNNEKQTKKERERERKRERERESWDIITARTITHFEFTLPTRLQFYHRHWLGSVAEYDPRVMRYQSVISSCYVQEQQ